jgi:hypothetical protein
MKNSSFLVTNLQQVACSRILKAVVGLIAFSAAAFATTFNFDTDPFAGTPVLNTPGRQIVGGESFIVFNPATDLFTFDAATFGVGDKIAFANEPVNGIPATDVNTVVLESTDNDNNPLTPFGAGNAADLIASRITEHGAGFFIYFNQSLDLARLVYSTDLADNTADLKILARMLNLNGAAGRAELANFSADNFEITGSNAPEPSSLVMLSSSALLLGCGIVRRRRTMQKHSQERQDV